jgi:hypothetical protein
MFDVSAGRKLLATLAVALLTAGCGGGSGTSAPPPGFDGDPSQAFTLTVRNEQLDAATVSLWIVGTRRPLGQVQGNGRRTFQVPLERSENISLEFDLLGGPRCRTQETGIRPGENLDITIPVNLNNMVRATCRRGE